MSFPVKVRHPERFKKWLSDVVVPQNLISCAAVRTRHRACSAFWTLRRAGGNSSTHLPTPPTPAVPAASNLIRRNLTEFWTNFQPDLPDIDDPPIALDDLWDEIRQRTAPWDTDVWGESPPTSEPSGIGDAGAEDDEHRVILFQQQKD